ncbi:hypothetical protein GCM10027341_49060 [Spirosoma knui]
MSRSLFLLIILMLTSGAAYAQRNASLKQELDSMYVLDQQYREYLSNIGQNTTMRDSLSNVFKVSPTDLGGVLWEKQSTIDKSNLARIEVILKQNGYPGKTLVGEPTNEAVWYIIQHSNKIEQYLPLIREAGKRGELPARLVAMMEDRQLMNKGKPQRYGTQGSCYPLRSTPNASECFIWPIDDPKGVNERRRLAGFTQTVEENATRLNITYKPLTIAQIKERYVLNLND